MKAIVLHAPGGPEALEAKEVADPAPKPGEVLVSAESIGLGRPDVMMRTGKYKWMPALPGIIGNELVGVVADIGVGVESHWMGRRVLVSARELQTRGGCYASAIAVPADALIDLPEHVDPCEATALPNYQLAWGLLHDATRGRLPRSVYLNGAAGGVGSALTQLCTQLGIAVIAGASSEAKRRFALAQGAQHAVDSGRPSGEIVAAVREARHGQGVDAVFDHLGGPGCGAHLDMLAPFGVLVSYNALKGPADGDVFAALRNHASRALSIAAYNMHAYNGPQMREHRRALLSTPIRWLAEGRLKPVVTQRFSLDQVVQAHTLLDTTHFVGKLVMTP